MNKSKLQELITEHGFLPDGDLIEFGEIVVKECIKLFNEARQEEVRRTGKAAFDVEERIKKHFDISNTFKFYG